MQTQQPTENGERYLSPSEAAKFVERLTGKRPHASTLARWMQRGLSGVRLKHIYALGTRRSRPEWIEAFFADVASAQQCGTNTPEPPSQRVAQAEAALARDGI